MPDDDWQLGQGTVEFRQAERDCANGRGVMALPSHRRVVLRGGPLDGESRSVLVDARRSWFKPELSDRLVEYRQHPDDSRTWLYVSEEGGKR